MKLGFLSMPRSFGFLSESDSTDSDSNDQAYVYSKRSSVRYSYKSTSIPNSARSASCDASDQTATRGAVTSRNTITGWQSVLRDIKKVTLAEVLESDAYREAFKEFCKTEQNEENVNFWEVATLFEQKAGLMGKRARKLMAKQIFKDFIDASAPTPLNLTADIADDVEIEILLGDVEVQGLNPNIFELVKKAVVAMMDDSFRRFKSSPFFECIATQELAKANMLEQHSVGSGNFNIFVM